MSAVWHFLVQDAGLVRSVTGWTVGFLMGTVLVPRIRRGIHDLVRELRLIADRLDTRTPGGLGDLVRDDRPDSRDR